ncbi:transmembrane protein 176 isoform X2 [Eleginops maclovinus]
MLGLMVMSYSIPLLFTEVTEVVLLGVPWWSGLMFITAGVVTIVLDKHCTMKILRVCLVVTMVSTVLSVVALIIYSVDMGKNPAVPCVKDPDDNCEQHLAAVAAGQRTEDIPPHLHPGPDRHLGRPLLPALQAETRIRTVLFSHYSCTSNLHSTDPPRAELISKWPPVCSRGD